MSEPAKQPIENAADIIEKFGGIRPMSSKINVAVTTVQGWKKRGVIPAARRALVIKSAIEHDIDLSDLVEGAPSIEKKAEEPAPAEIEVETPVKAEVETEVETTISSVEAKLEEVTDQLENDISDEENSNKESDELNKESDDEEPEQEEQQEEDNDLEIPVALRRTLEAESTKKKKTPLASKQPKSSIKPQAHNSINSDYAEVVVGVNKSAVTRSVIIAVVVILLILAAIAGVLLPKYEKFEKRDARIMELESKLSEMKKEQSSFKGLVPENWSEELAELKKQASRAQAGIGSAVETAGNLSRDLTTQAGLNSRVEQLQTYVSGITGDNGVYALKARFDEMRNSFMGQKILDNSVAALLPLLQKSEGKDEEQVNAEIDSARNNSRSLQASLGSVPKTELKAAAMLLAMTQVRSALNRNEEAFDGDLELLMNMVDEDNVELRAAIEKLAPHSREGVLSVGGLKEEFQTVAGDAVAASLRGEDVSVSDKFMSRFNEVLKVEKDGELLTGTQTQVTLNEAEHLVTNEQWPEAVSLLKTKLGANELAPLKPWINKAEGLIHSKNLSRMIEDAIDMNFGTGLLGGSKALDQNGHR